MVDTIRTLAQLITASADNTSGAYTNQNMRDFILTAASWTAGDLFDVADYGAVLDGVTDDTPAWQRAVNAAVARGAGTITAPTGSVSAIAGSVSVAFNNIGFYLPNVTIKLTGSGAQAALNFGGTLGASSTLSVNALAYATQITVSVLGGIAAGSWLLIQKAAPANGGAVSNYVFVPQVRSISGTGPWVVTLESALPVAFNTADLGLALTTITPVANVGVTGNVTFDGSGASGSPAHGIQALYVINSVFNCILGTGLNNGAAIYANIGHGNLFEDINCRTSGNASFDGIFLIGQTASQADNLRQLNGTGFGIQLQGWCYGTGSGHISEGAQSGRGLKYQACLQNDFANLQSHFSSFNGVAISVGSCNNTFTGVSANANVTSEGLWFSDQFNTGNRLFGVNARGNATRDVYVGTTDTGNEFYGVSAGIIEIHNATTLWFGLNGAVVSAGQNGIVPVRLLGVTASGAGLLLPNGAGAGTEAWIGTASAGAETWLNGTVSMFLAINNVQIAQITAAGFTVPTQLNLTSAAGCNVRSGSGAASGTQPLGSLWLRTDGGVGTTLYVSRGGGTWNAVAGV